MNRTALSREIKECLQVISIITMKKTKDASTEELEKELVKLNRFVAELAKETTLKRRPS